MTMYIDRRPRSSLTEEYMRDGVWLPAELIDKADAFRTTAAGADPARYSPLREHIQAAIGGTIIIDSERGQDDLVACFSDLADYMSDFVGCAASGMQRLLARHTLNPLHEVTFRELIEHVDAVIVFIDSLSVVDLDRVAEMLDVRHGTLTTVLWGPQRSVLPWAKDKLGALMTLKPLLAQTATGAFTRIDRALADLGAPGSVLPPSTGPSNKVTGGWGGTRA